MQPHEERLVQEFDELSLKRRKLLAFIASEDFRKLAEEDRLLLDLQADSMRQYSSILHHRIARLKGGV